MFSMKIKELRNSKNLNQEDVAKAIGITKNTYIKYENGTQSPKLETIEKLSEFFGVTTAELISDIEPTVNGKLGAKLKLIEQLDDEEKKSIMMMIEGLILRNQSKIISKEFKT
ncbi:TPA: helix-turn-helix transcriptional regulator [Vibrio parahaemolyticus]|nr:helix-turn-helix transcriptional regulator [Vibrio parahaemolyticus]HCH4043588.1 helix-turn-helix transcriptional regulator [Vibrio parahaemolyticus]HCH4823309.1 helix-turn-helix transcriptional regulator [Vibrio parahaemolyticus]HCH5839174.1 helix-turn-helix transcriptional regulator [Vibrio parahaemolyticus]